MVKEELYKLLHDNEVALENIVHDKEEIGSTCHVKNEIQSPIKKLKSNEFILISEFLPSQPIQIINESFTKIDVNALKDVQVIEKISTRLNKDKYYLESPISFLSYEDYWKFARKSLYDLPVANRGDEKVLVNITLHRDSNETLCFTDDEKMRLMPLIEKLSSKKFFDLSLGFFLPFYSNQMNGYEAAKKIFHFKEITTNFTYEQEKFFQSKGIDKNQLINSNDFKLHMITEIKILNDKWKDKYILHPLSDQIDESLNNLDQNHHEFFRFTKHLNNFLKTPFYNNSLLRYTYIFYYTGFGAKNCGDLIVGNDRYCVFRFIQDLTDLINENNNNNFNFDLVLVLDSCYSGFWVKVISAIETFRNFPLLIQSACMPTKTCKTFQLVDHIDNEEGNCDGLYYYTDAYKGSFKGIGTKVIYPAMVLSEPI